MDNISVINKREVTLVQYLVMIYEAEERWASKSSAEQSWFMRQHQLPSEKLLADGVSCIGHPLMPTATAVSLRVRGGSRQGVPDHPVAWLVTVGRHLAIDRLRRSRFESPLADEWDVAGAEPDIGAAAETLHLNDDLLRLLFTCCHPALSEDGQITSMLRVVLDFSEPEIAAALLTQQDTVERRLTRASSVPRQGHTCEPWCHPCDTGRR